MRIHTCCKFVHFLLLVLQFLQTETLPPKRAKLETNSVTKRISIRKAENPLPKPFELPLNFTPNVQAGLTSKSLHGKARSKFITLIAQSIYRLVKASFQLYSHLILRAQFSQAIKI